MDRLRASIDRLADEAVEITAQLVRIASDGPANDERAVVTAIRDAADRLGLPAGEIVAAEAAHPNLLIRVPGAAPGRRLILTSHTDTKPPGDDADPWSGAIHHGRLHGLGAADAKGSVASMLVAAAALRDAGLPLAGELLLVFSADEESDGTRGLAQVASTGALGADAAIVGEPSGVEVAFDTLPLLARGFAGFTLRASGRPLHSGLAGWSRQGADPIASIARAIVGLPALADLPPPSRLTFTSLGGGLADGILPATAWVRGEVRTLPGQTRDDVVAAIRDGIQRLHERHGDREAPIEVDVDPVDWPASAIDEDEPIVTALAAAIEQVIGRRAEPGTFPGATEAHVLAGLGVPTVPAFGPGLLESAHVPGESIAIDDVRTAVAIYARAAAAFLA